MKEFAERLKQRQTELRITQKDLARRVNISDATIANYIHGRSLPPIDVACQIANELCVSIGWLCGGDDR